MTDTSQPEPQPDLANQLMVLRIMWGGVAAVGILYAGVLSFLTNQADAAPAPAVAPVVGYALGAAGLLASLSSFALRPILLSPRRVAAALEAGGMRQAVALMTIGHLMVWAVADACGVMGFVLGFLGGRPAVAYGLIALGVGLVLAHMPTAHTMPDLLTAAEQERLRNQG